ncbi:hypothetical protein ACL1ID_13720, partial [Corynebacterium striatum]
MKENPLQYRVRGTPVPTTRTRGTNYPKSTTPAQAWEIISHAQPPTQPIDPDVLWTKIAKQYHRIHPDNQAD